MRIYCKTICQLEWNSHMQYKAEGFYQGKEYIYMVCFTQGKHFGGVEWSKSGCTKTAVIIAIFHHFLRLRPFWKDNY